MSSIGLAKSQLFYMSDILQNHFLHWIPVPLLLLAFIARLHTEDLPKYKTLQRIRIRACIMGSDSLSGPRAILVGFIKQAKHSRAPHVFVG
jgi:hypothetical protein